MLENHILSYQKKIKKNRSLVDMIFNRSYIIAEQLNAHFLLFIKLKMIFMFSYTIRKQLNT